MNILSDIRKKNKEIRQKHKALEYLMAEIIGDLIDKDTYYAPIISMSKFIPEPGIPCDPLPHDGTVANR